MSINIDDLTVGDAKKLAELFQNNNANEKKYPVEIGKAYLFRTVTHIELGRVASVSGQFATLEDASWIADTGRYHDALKNGSLSEIEPYPNTTTVNMESLINFAPWDHKLPKDQK
jgi:hypothetical protein